MASPAKVTITTLTRILEDLIAGSEDSIGDYLYKGLHVQISEYGLSGPERVKHANRRDATKDYALYAAKR